ncbi:Plant self-incompatibility response, partial [Arabidopsis thaliana x Arabidopsis arenosa]
MKYFTLFMISYIFISIIVFSHIRHDVEARNRICRTSEKYYREFCGHAGNDDCLSKSTKKPKPFKCVCHDNR